MKLCDTLKYCLKNIIYFVLGSAALRKLYKLKRIPILSVASDTHEAHTYGIITTFN